MHRRASPFFLSTVAGLSMGAPAFLASPEACAEDAYHKPPRAILDILNSPPTPTVSLSPARDQLLLIQATGAPSIADLAEPMLRLAGLRINPRTHGPAREGRTVGLTLVNLADGKSRPVALPANPHVGMPVWSPDGKRFAFTNTAATSIELWVGDVATAEARRVPGVTLQAVYGQPLHWMPDGRTLLCHVVVAGKGPPEAPKAPVGPTIQESAGKKSPVRTFQDLLQNAHDADLFEYYATSQLTLVDLNTHEITSVGRPGILRSEPAPNGEYLLVIRTTRPFSFLHPAAAFPKEIEIWDRRGNVVHSVARLPLADQVPIEGVPTGPRDVRWRPTEPATLVWVEALDGGDPKRAVPYRDRVLMKKASFQGPPVEAARTQHRCMGITWGETAGLALVREYDRDRRWNRTLLVDVDQPARPGRVLWDRSAQDHYRDPGTPVLRTLPSGGVVLRQQGTAIFLTGQGASPQGDRPFLDRLDLTTLETKRLFQCEAGCHESVAAVLSDDGQQVLTRYETVTEPPNYFLRSLAEGGKKAVTHFTDPAPQLRAIQKKLVTYKRADGVQLSFTLYLPPDYRPGQRLPTVVWAYPREYNDPDTAGQVTGSPNHFTTLRGPSHLFFLLQGYAILDGATMPVVGDPETVNNTFIEQIVSSARAAIDKAVELGVTDRNRVGVGGHSYGAFMTANLLAHSDLFRAGIARSGAYNRTLTPFGFQSERRTLWEAPDMYVKVSPFLYAHKIKTPLLLIHGAADNNPGTFPIQSERMYQAVKGNGGTVRFVSLPHESHAYVARESVEHTLYEMITWFDRYVKNAPESSK
jgi:dipeptidyl aminopeptidase/acylaminoacyl peptidase